MPQTTKSYPVPASDDSEKSHPVGRWEIATVVIVLSLVVCAIFGTTILSGRAYYWGDIGLFFLPLNSFLKTSLQSGNVPLWNPYLFCGAPFIGNPQVSLLYPSTLLLPFFPAVTAIMMSEAVHIFAAGLFFWLLARKGTLKLDFLPSLLASLVYMLGGYFVAKAQFPNMLAALTYVPLLLYLVELLVLAPDPRRIVIFGASLAMQLLAAHTQITVFSVYLMVPYGLFAYYSRQDRQPFIRVAIAGICGGLLAVALSCAYWLPVAQLIHSSARQALTLRIANRFYLPWYEVGNFIFPHLYGSPMRGDWHAHGNYWETDNYIGIVPFALALAGCIALWKFEKPRSERRRQFVFWSITFVVSLLLSLGSAGILYRVAFVLLPGLRAFHDPARLMLGANIAAALFAGRGAEFLAQGVPSRQRLAVAVTLIVLSAVDLGWHDHGLYPLKSVVQIEQMDQSPVVKLISANAIGPGAGRVFMPDSRRSWENFTTYKSFEENDPDFMQQWPDTLSPCLGMTYGLREAGGYDPEYRKDSQELLDFAVEPLLPRTPHQTPLPPQTFQNLSRYMSVLGIEYLVTYRVNTVNVPGLQEVYISSWNRHGRHVAVYHNLAYTGRSALYTNWRNVQGQTRDILNLVGSLRGEGPFGLPIIEDMPETSEVQSPQAPQPVKVVKDLPDEVDLSCAAASRPSVLILADTMHPGWTAYVDGIPKTIFRANGDQRAVLIPAGPPGAAHSVDFRYAPADFLVGLYVTLAATATTLFILIGVKDRQITAGR